VSRLRKVCERIVRGTATAETKWRHFEHLVAAIHKAADAGAEVRWNEVICGRQFDVTIRYRNGLYDHLTIVECKDYEAFVTKSRDARANLAVLASTSGFQSGAKDCAQRHNITLLHVTPSDEVDLSVFGARWGDPVDALHIEAITLEYVGGDKKRLSAMSNELTYYANHRIY
jgi:Restriction endonuclease